MIRALIVLAGAIPIGFSAEDTKTDEFPKLIVGKWEITKAGGSAPAGTTLEFTKDNKVTMELSDGDEKVTVAGTYTIEKDKLTLQFKFGDDETEETLHITKLTDMAMELKDKDDGIDILKKLK
jgi:uncharacterized protein (TIGR03066 family)